MRGEMWAEGAYGNSSMTGDYVAMVTGRRVQRRFALLIAAALASVLALALCSCAASEGRSRGSDDDAVAMLSANAPDIEVSDESAAGAPEGADETAAVEHIEYPSAWLIVDSDGIPAGTAVRVLSLPGIDIAAHRDGKPLQAEERDRIASSWPSAGDSDALVEYEGHVHAMDPDLLLVNLPDILPEAIYDVVYSYGATSNCAGLAIPGVTGERLPGYADGMQESAYWGARTFVAPCAYRTTIKAMAASETLRNTGYRLLVYDAYRPMTTQRHLSDAFAAAYEADSAIQAGVGGWPLAWYVASGASGHNYGTDLDVGVCNLEGAPAPLPSTFDAFDESGHLTANPMSSEAIAPANYRDAVKESDACMALHEAFTNVGFAELASEWWHFGDDETEAKNIALVGPDGLDFVAMI